jgi:glycine cleavage system H protein
MGTYYTKEHEWISIDDGTGIVGITAYAAQQLGDITFIDLPKTGKETKKGDILCAIESVKAASDIYAPMSGRVLEVNKKLDSEPQIINEKAESDGWIVKLQLSNPSESDKLMNRNQYEEYLKGL